MRTPSAHLLFGAFALLLAGGMLVGCGSSAPRFRSGQTGEGDELVGIASYYADEFHGRKTANGEVYDMHALTAAHRTLPFNTRVRVTSRDTGKSVVVRINDRGPFKDNRIIDLSLAAAKAIGMIGAGTAPVLLEILEIPPSGQ
jgi:rare lipoprotein A